MLQSTPDVLLATVLAKRREVLCLADGLNTVLQRPRAERFIT